MPGAERRVFAGSNMQYADIHDYADKHADMDADKHTD
jgi:hypothetical protein